MSIHNFYNKIKGLYVMNKRPILHVFILLLVSLSAFYLGRVSVELSPNSLSNNVVTVFVK